MPPPNNTLMPCSFWGLGIATAKRGAGTVAVSRGTGCLILTATTNGHHVTRSPAAKANAAVCGPPLDGIWEFSKIRGTVFWGPCFKDPAT